MKRCPTCKETKEPSSFYKNKAKGDGLSSECKSCFLERSRRRPRDYVAQKDRRFLLKKYGLDEKVYAALLEKQSGGCAICGKKDRKRLAVDHCHKRGAVRGLLCFQCNTGLGKFQDSEQLLLKAAEYLATGRK